MIDILVIGRFGEWGGWNNADGFQFQNQRTSLLTLLGFFTKAFKKTKLALPVAGQTFGSDNAEARTQKWAYDQIWKRTYPNLMLKTHTVTGRYDYFSPSWYPTDQSYTSWFIERASAKVPTIFEGVGMCLEYNSSIYSVQRYIDNILFRMRSNYNYCNNINPHNWSLYQKVYSDGLSRLQRNFGYRLRPAHVGLQTLKVQNQNYLIVDHTWVNGGTGFCPCWSLSQNHFKKYSLFAHNFGDSSHYSWRRVARIAQFRLS